MNNWTSRSVRCFLAWFCLMAAAPFAHALSMGISVNPDRVRPGEVVTVAVTVTNDTSVTVSGLSVQVQMPAAGIDTLFDTSLLSEGGACSQYCNPGEQVTWNLGSLAPGQGKRVSMVAAVTAATTDGFAIAFPARLFVGTVQSLAVSQTVNVDADNALSLAVDTDIGAVDPGGTMTYSLAYGNRSNGSVTGTTLTLPLPAGVTFVSASGGGALSGNSVVWALNTLQSGQSGRQQAVVSVGVGQPSGRLLAVDAAQVAGTSPVTGTELARSTLVTRVQANPTLLFTMAPSADPARADEAVRVALTVSNPTGGEVFGAVLKLRMPTEGLGTIFDPTLLSGGAECSQYCNPAEFVRWNIGALAPGASVTVLMVADVAGGYASGRLIRMDAELQADGVAPLIASRTIGVDGDRSLSLLIDTDRDAAAPGERMTYTVTYGNRGAANVTGAVLKLPLPSGVNVVSVSGGGTLSGSIVQWPLNTVLAGQSGREQVVVTTTGTLPSGTLLPIDAADLTGTSAVTGVETVRTSLTSRLHVNPALLLSIASNADPARPDEAVRIAFTISNRSDSPAFGVVLRARMPTQGLDTIFDPNLLIGGAVCSQYCNPYEFITWNIGNLAPGGSKTVQLIATAAGGYASGRLIAVESELFGDGIPMVIGRRAIASDADNALSLALHADKDSVAPGEQLTYVLDYGNRSAATITSTTLRLTVPEGATLVGSSGGTMTGRMVSWNIGGILPGTGGRRTVTVAVPPTAARGLALQINAATLAGTSAFTGAEAARASLTTRVVAGNPLRLSLTGLGPNPTRPGQPLTARLNVSNTGAVPLNTVQLLVRMPTEGVDTIFNPASIPGAQCSQYCNPYEFVVWNLGSVGAGASTTVALPMTVNNIGNGRQILLEAVVTDDSADQSLASGTVLVGTQLSPPPPFVVYGDFDGNGVVGFSDLALFRANFGSTNEVYDLDRNGSVNFADLAILKSVFGNSAPAASSIGRSSEAQR